MTPPDDRDRAAQKAANHRDRGKSLARRHLHLPVTGKLAERFWPFPPVRAQRGQTLNVCAAQLCGGYKPQEAWGKPLDAPALAVPGDSGAANALCSPARAAPATPAVTRHKHVLFNETATLTPGKTRPLCNRVHYSIPYREQGLCNTALWRLFCGAECPPARPRRETFSLRSHN